MLGLTIASLPPWALEILALPGTETAPAFERGLLLGSEGQVGGTVDRGIARFPIPEVDSSIDFYRGIGGARFHERSAVPYATSALDTEIYHGYLAELRPENVEAVIVDVGGGDGRNTLPWLRWGFRRVVMIDAAYAALARFRDRIAAEQREWLDRLLLIEADIRRIPLRSGCAVRVQAIEALAYLNEDYAEGLRQCARLLADGGRLVVADRDYEAGLLTRLFYSGGVRGMLEQADKHTIWDGNAESVVHSRCFTADEFAAMMQNNGLLILSHRGVSALSLVLGHEWATKRLVTGDVAHLSQVHALLRKLGATGQMRRSHVIVAQRR